MKSKYPLIIVFVGLLIGLFGPFYTQAQRVDLDEKPWLRRQFPKVPSDQIYQYQIGRGEGDTYTDAQGQAIMDFLTSLPSFKEINSTCRNYLLDEFKNGETTGASKFECDDEVTQKIRSLSSRIDENYTRSATGKHQVQILFAFQDPDLDGYKKFDPITPHYTNTYGWSAGWRSLLVPGWGQFHKKTSTKGVVFLGGVLAAGGASIFFESRRSDNSRKSQETNNIDLIRAYRDNADNAALYRNIGLSAAGGLWIWAVIDAMNTKGAKKYDYRKTARLYASRDGLTLGIRL